MHGLHLRQRVRIMGSSIHVYIVVVDMDNTIVLCAISIK